MTISERDIQKILNRFTKAYLAVNGEEPTIEIREGGYVSIDGVKYRISDVPVLTKILERKVK